MQMSRLEMEITENTTKLHKCCQSGDIRSYRFWFWDGGHSQWEQAAESSAYLWLIRKSYNTEQSIKTRIMSEREFSW